MGQKILLKEQIMQCIWPSILEKPILGVVLIPEKDELWISNGNNVFVRTEKELKENLISGEKSFRTNDRS